MLKKLFLSQNVALGIITTKSTTPKFNNSLLHQYFSFPISLTRFCTTTTHPFAVSYLINNFGFSPLSALKAFNNNQVLFKSAENPNSVINFFKNRDFSHSDIRIIIRKAPWLLSLQPHNIILPKFEFFLSKGATSSDIVSFITENPRILRSSLEKRIIPLFQLLSSFLKTNKDVILCLLRHSTYVTFNSYHLVAANINLMTDFGVSDSVIASLLQKRPSIFGSTDLIKSLEEVKCLGFDPSTATFGAALFAKKCMSKTRWDEKVAVFKKWGWSDETFFQAFRLHPSLMLTSIEKINFVMHFWVNQLGWDSLELTKCPHMFGYSLHQRIIPRASVLQFLLMKGLQDKNESLVTPFTYSEKFFLSKFVFKEECDYLLKLYVEKMKPAYTKENNGMPFTN
ncbi:putative transcription regulator mTERF family [Medicago truncatula]|uniref:Putative transcription regulator mTERF family n=1 Tax=Medicago truncatula TaxID=3880 RepID=A0A072V6Q5_MEDTR|nr:transcription termination factor MTERF5, chloroplastic [Medicago truncatula]KEH37296.1 mTERF protein [Medicago truncatula]RHN73228.1 putative transcription regulator mTERF family [Medicago truncatula]